MASIQHRAGRWQVRVKSPLLPKPHFATFTEEGPAREYGAQLDALLAQGIVPTELLEPGVRGDNPKLFKVLELCLASAPLAPTDRPTMELLQREVGETRLQSVTAAWADKWVTALKVDQRLAPGTVRKRVEALSRAISWYVRASNSEFVNPLRNMPRGYSQPTPADIQALAAMDAAPKRDTHRDRRLSSEEEARCRAALAGEKREGKERPLDVDPEFSLLFDVLLNTGVRLSEGFMLQVGSIDFRAGVIKLDGTKGHRGAVKRRVVPMTPYIRERLQEWCRGRAGRVFSFWDGTPGDRKKCSARLSHRFTTLFDHAQVQDCTTHDLRHEATCRWFEMRRASGGWVFSEIEICKIMGWSDPKMALRYASLRGEDLAARLLG